MLKQAEQKDEFEQIFKDNYKYLYLYTLNFVKNEEEAKDLVSNVFEYVWKNYDKLKITHNTVSYIYMLLRSKCIDYLRHQKAILKYQQHILFGENYNLSTDEYDEINEQILKVREILEKLSPQAKKVVTKSFLEGKKYKEVAKEMNISVHTVKDHITQSLRIFRDNLRKHKP